MSAKSVILLIAGCLILFGTFVSAEDVDVSGDWEITMVGGPPGGGPPGGGPPRGAPAGGPPGGGGDRPARVVTFTQNGEELQLTMRGPRGDEMQGTGNIVGNEIEFSITMTGGPGGRGGEMSIVHKGIVEGDTMKGTVVMGDRGEMEWEAKRVVDR